MGMSIEELQAEILRLNKENENLTATIKGKDELLEGFKSREVEHASKISDYQEKIMTLRDMNTDLFLRVSQPIPDVQEPVVEEPKQEEVHVEDILW